MRLLIHLSELHQEISRLEQTYQLLESADEPGSDSQKLKKTVLLLAAKKILANTRQSTISSLIATGEKSEKTNRIATRLERIGELVGNVEDFADLIPGGKIATRVLSKGLPVAANLLKKRSLKSQAKEFKDYLIEDEKALALLRKIYKSLDSSLQSSQSRKMSPIMTDLLSFDQDKLSQYSIFEVGKLKEDEKLTADKISQVIDSLTNHLEEFVKDLKEELNQCTKKLEESLAGTEGEILQQEIEELLNKLVRESEKVSQQ